MEGSTLLWGGPLRAFSRRLCAGTGETEALARRSPSQFVTGVVISGQVHMEDEDKTFVMDFHKGDLYRYYGKKWPARWSISNQIGPGSLELRVIENRAWVRPEIMMSSSTGKAGGLSPPMLLP